MTTIVKSPLFLGSLAALLASIEGAAQATNDATTLQSLREELEALWHRIQVLEQKLAEFESCRTAAPPARVPAPPMAASAASTPPQQTTWSPAEPMTVARSGQAYMNLSFGALMTAGGSTSADVTEDLELGHHDPSGNGFTLQCAEIALDGAVDPYFRGFGNVCFGLEADGHTHVGLEEAYLLTTSLPANLQVKAGQFLAEFGRENTLHAHQWNFVDQAIILNRLLGPHSLRNPGARLGWLLPTSFYSELWTTKGLAVYTATPTPEPVAVGGPVRAPQPERPPTDASAAQQRLRQRLSQIRQKILVLSGKGGVGKSTVAANLAMSFAMAGCTVGLLDIDIHGPSIPKLLELEGEGCSPGTEDGATRPVPVGPRLKVMSIGFLVAGPRDAVIWRGPLKYKLIQQFLADVAWGSLDVLVIDSPPGTGDEPLSIAQLVGGPAGAVVVTTPQDVAVADGRELRRLLKGL